MRIIIKHVVNKVNLGIYALMQISYLCSGLCLSLFIMLNIESHVYFGIRLYDVNYLTKKNLKNAYCKRKIA